MTPRRSFDNARRQLAFAHETGSSLCAPFLAVVPVSGAAISVLNTPAAQTTICASDAVAARLDDLQFDLGEGPCWEAMRHRAPVLHPDLPADTGNSWPHFAAAVRGEPVGAMFAFPLIVGSLELGAIDLYSEEPARLTATQISDAAALADVASWQVLRRILSDQEEDSDGGGYSRREVHQATGMVLVQLGTSAEDATLLLRAHAFSTGRSVREVANDVVERRLDFSEARKPESAGE